jgi:flavorubredoxin
MNNAQQIIPGIYWIGGNDFNSTRFENEFPLPHGVTYNSYFIDDEKTAVIDAVDLKITDLFLENVRTLLKGRPLDYVIVNHMEPDHGGALLHLLNAFPEARLTATVPALRMFAQYFHTPEEGRTIKIADKQEISLGRRTLRFFTAPMVHWPEVTFTYDVEDRILFSADAFGTYGVLHGSIFADAVDYRELYLPEMRRYYSNIVMRYGMAVKNAMKKVADVPVDMICPLHGPVFRTKEDIDLVTGKVAQWASFEPEKNSAAVFFASAYGHTDMAAQKLAFALCQRGVKDVRLIDLCSTPVSMALPYVLMYSHIVLAAPTYNMGIFPPMDTFINFLLIH